jgi:hypothetical protein
MSNDKPVQAYDGLGDIVGFVPPRLIAVPVLVDNVKPESNTEPEHSTPEPEIVPKPIPDHKYPNF